MRRSKSYDSLSAHNRDLKSKSDLEAGLAQEHTELTINTLREFLSKSRIELIDKVIDSRTSTIQVAVEGLKDPNNIAAILRTADAFGIYKIHIISENGKFRFSTAVTQGAHKWLDITVYDNVETFFQCAKEKKLQVLIADMQGSEPVEALNNDTPKILVFGNESEGISEKMRQLSDGAFRIPMYGFVESLNVSVAAAISISVLKLGRLGDLCPAEKNILRAKYYLRSVKAGKDIIKRTLSSNKQ